MIGGTCFYGQGSLTSQLTRWWILRLMRLSKSPSKVFCPSVCIANTIHPLVAVEDVLKYSYGRLEHFVAKLGDFWH